MLTSLKKARRQVSQRLTGYWSDPVWSKVIATAITATLGVVFVAVMNRVNFRSAERSNPSSFESGSPSPNSGSPPGTRPSDRQPDRGADSIHETKTPAPVVREPAPRPLQLVNRGAFNPSSAAVLFCNRDSKDVSSITNEVAARIQGIGGLFTGPFIESGLFARAMGGDVTAITEAGVTEAAASLIVLGTRSIVITPQEPVPGIGTFKAVGSVTVRVFKPRAGFQSEMFTEEVVSPGFDAAGAERAADRELIARIVQRLASPR